MTYLTAVGLIAALSLPGGVGEGGASLAGQTQKPLARLHGVVQDGKGAPVEGARIAVRDLDQVAVTGADGEYAFEAIRPGRYWVTIRGPGFDPQRRAITLESGEDRDLQFALDPLAAALAGSRTREMDSLSADFARRAESSLDRYFLTRDDIERSRQPLLGGVLRHYMVPLAPRSGVRYASGCAQFETRMVERARRMSGGEEIPMISINGARPLRGRTLYEVEVNEIEAVEVYRGATSPMGFTSSENQCGLIIIWTK